MNPIEMMKLGERLKVFQSQHPRVGAFLTDVAEHAIMTGSIVEMKVTDPDGKEYITNIRLTQEDMETVEILKGLKR